MNEAWATWSDSVIAGCSFFFNPTYESDEGKVCVKECRTEQQDCLDGQWCDSECLESCEEQAKRVRGYQFQDPQGEGRWAGFG